MRDHEKLWSGQRSTRRVLIRLNGIMIEDLRYATRVQLKSPGYLVALVTLALGIE